MKKKNKLTKFILLTVPYIIGAGGLLTAGERVPDALFYALNMYVLNYGDAPPNAAVEVARWLAPLATASGILLAVARMRDWLINYIRYHRGNSIAVWGPLEQRRNMLEQLGNRGVDGGDDWTLVPAQEYLLVAGEEENLRFYGEMRSRLAGRTVYLQSQTLPAQSVTDPGLRLFCLEETAARLFWKRRCPYKLFATNGNKMQIVLLGFGELGSRLLTYALLDNIFAPNQRIEYHVFGGGEEFAAVHTELSEICDPVILHSEPWYKALPLLEQAQMCIVLPQEDQLGLIQKLLLATNVPVIDVFASDAGALELLADHERIRTFLWEKEGRKFENIFGSVMFDKAKALNMRYAHLYSGIEETPENREIEWTKLDGFTRYSNVSAADYHEIRLYMLSVLGWPSDAEKLNAQQLEFLSYLEHIRWCRYHQLNNWRQGIPENGRRKDAAKRIHADLIPYEQLTEQEKQKDRDNIKLLLSFTEK